MYSVMQGTGSVVLLNAADKVIRTSPSSCVMSYSLVKATDQSPPHPSISIDASNNIMVDTSATLTDWLLLKVTTGAMVIYAQIVISVI